MRRPEARELVFKMLYQMEAQNDFSEESKQSFYEEFFSDDDEKEYLEAIYKAFIENKEDIDKKILDNSKGWKMNRIAKVDLAILRLSVSEFVYTDLVPVGASINEAVNLGKKFGSEESGKFINGILGSISRA